MKIIRKWNELEILRIKAFSYGPLYNDVVKNKCCNILINGIRIRIQQLPTQLLQ